MVRSCLAVGAALALLLACTPARADGGDGRPVGYVDIDLTWLGVAVSGSANVGSTFYLGGGLGLLPQFSLNSFEEIPLPIEMLEAHAFVRWAPRSFFHLGLGGRLTTALEGPLDDMLLVPYVGPYVDAFIGFEYFKIGSRVSVAWRTDDGEVGVLFYPALLRIQIPL